MFNKGDLVQYKIPSSNYNSKLEHAHRGRLGVVLESNMPYTTVLWCDTIGEEGWVRTTWLEKIN